MEQEDWQEPDKHAGARIEDEIGPEHSCNGTARSDGRDSRVRIEQDLRHCRRNSTQKIEDQVSKMAEVIFDVIAENPQKKHIARNMDQVAMQKHGGEKGKNCRCGWGQRLPREDDDSFVRHDTELIDKSMQRRRVLAVYRTLQ